MKALATLFITVFTAYAGVPIKLDTFSADFVQSITDDHNKTIRYSGHVIAQKKDKAAWHYKKPIEKSIYIYNGRVTVVEPDLEQAIIKKLEDDINLFSLLENALKISPDTYRANYDAHTYDITLNGKEISRIFYRDSFDNNVTITFEKQQHDLPIEEKKFEPVIPADYDIIDN